MENSNVKLGMITALLTSMKELKIEQFLSILLLIFISTASLYGVDYDLLGKWNVYSFSKRWITTEKDFRTRLEHVDNILPDEQWEFTSQNSYKVEGVENLNIYTESYEILDFNKIYKSSIIFISNNEFFIITRHSEGSSPFGLISINKFVRFHQIRNVDIISMPISSFNNAPQRIKDQFYPSNKLPPDNSPATIVQVPAYEDSETVPASSSPETQQQDQMYQNASSANLTELYDNDSKNNSVEKEGKELTGSETFTEEFYYYVNAYRAENGLGYLERDTRAEKVAADYSKELARIQAISHDAIAGMEFKALCSRYDLNDEVMSEILAYYPFGETPSDVLTIFQGSPPHNRALLTSGATSIGAGYVTRNGTSYFTAYMVVPGDDQ